MIKEYNINEDIADKYIVFVQNALVLENRQKFTVQKD